MSSTGVGGDDISCMSRSARFCLPYTFQHVVYRFVDGEFRFIADEDRSGHLNAVTQLRLRVDWEIYLFRVDE